MPYVYGLSARKKPLFYYSVVGSYKKKIAKIFKALEKAQKHENFTIEILKTPQNFDSLFSGYRHLCYQL